MAAKKIKDIAVKTGTYNVGGETKNRYENVGALMEGDNGPYIMLKRTFNPAGVDCEPGRDSILLSCFDLRDERPAPQQGRSSGSATGPSAPMNNGGDDVPF